MPKLTTMYDRYKSTLLIEMLEEEGIAFITKDETKSSMGEIAPLAQPIHFFINNAEDLKKSQNLLSQIKKVQVIREQSNWECGTCHEIIEAQFTNCWNCSTDRPTLINSDGNTS